MNIFSKTCSGEEYKDNFFFQEWHRAIIRDFEIFKNMLSGYQESSAKKLLVDNICSIQRNIMNPFDSEDEIILKSTPNYFLFSFYYKCDEIPTYVLLSKDYKKILIASEEMEYFDADDEYDQDERFGIYDYTFFKIENNQVFCSREEIKEGTPEYNGRFSNVHILFGNVEDSEKLLDYLLKINNSKIKQIKL